MAVLAGYRAWQPDGEVRLPLLPLAVIRLGSYIVAALGRVGLDAVSAVGVPGA